MIIQNNMYLFRIIPIAEEGLHPLEFGVGKKKRLRALRIEVYFNLVVLRHFVAVHTKDCSLPEHPMRHAVAGFPLR